MSPEIVSKVDKRWKEYGLGASGRRARSCAGRDRALGVRAAVRVPRGARPRCARHGVQLARPAAHHGRDGRRPHVRDGRQPDHRPAHRRPQSPYGAARTGHRRGQRAHGLDRRGRRAGRLPRRGRAAEPAVPGARAARAWCRWSSTRTRKRFTDWPHAILGAGADGRAGRRLARGHRHVRRVRAGVGCSASRSGCGSAASTSSTPARTPRSTGRSACAACRRGTASRSRSHCPRRCTW